MSNRDKKYVAENSETGTSARRNEVDDLPPPYTSYAPSSDPKPPPPPKKPPALTQEPPPATTTRVIPGPGPQMTDNNTSDYSAWEGCKAACSSVLCWPPILCPWCITCSSCAHSCPEPKPRRNR